MKPFFHERMIYSLSAHRIRIVTVLFSILISFFMSVPPLSAESNAPPELVLQTGHGNISGITADITPNGMTVVSAGDDRRMIVWDVRTGKKIRSFELGYEAERLFTLPDGETVILIGNNADVEEGVFEDDILEIRKIADGEVQWRYSAIYLDDLSLSQDRTFAAACNGGDLYLVDLLLKKLMSFSIEDLERGGLAEAGIINFTAVSPDKTQVALGNNEGFLMIWDIAEQTFIDIVQICPEGLNQAVFSPDGRSIFVAGGDGTIRQWDWKNHRILKEFQGVDDTTILANDIDVSDNGNLLICADDDDQNVLLWDVKAGTLLKTLIGHDIYLKHLLFYNGGRRILSTGDDGAICLWDASDGKNLAVLGGVSKSLDEAVISPNGEFFATADNQRIFFRDAKTGKLIQTIYASVPQLLFLSDNGRVVAYLKGFQYITFWDIKNRKEILSLNPWAPNSYGPLIYQADFDLEAGHAFFSDGDNRIHYYDCNTEKILWSVNAHEETIRDVAFSPDGRYVISSGNDGYIRFWERDNGRLSKEFFYDENSIVSFRITPDGKKLVAVSTCRGFPVWNMETGELVYRGDLPNNGESIILSPNGETAYTGGDDGVICAVDLETGRVLNRFPGHSGIVDALAVFPGGTHILSAGQDGTTRIRNTQTGEFASYFVGKDGEWLAYTEDGYWDSSPNGGELVAMVRGNDVWNIDQFAVRTNRPDKIVSRLPNPDTDLMNHYFLMHKKRLRRMGLTEEELDENYHVPSAEIRDAGREGKFLRLELSFSDDFYNLTSYNVYVNDVPLYDGGNPLKGRRAVRSETVELNSGRNKVEVSCMNAQGTESFRDYVVEDYDQKVSGNLYYIGFGVSHYKDEQLNLGYAHQDALDLAVLFNGMAGVHFEHAYAYYLIDEKVSAEYISRVKEVLRDATVDDTVVLFIAGHGVYEQGDDPVYYYVTYETDLDDLAATAANFEMIEDILRGIAPRKKLFLMDTCESGEIDEEEWEVSAVLTDSRGIRARSIDENRGLGRSEGRSFHSPRPFLNNKDSYIYNDLLRRSGAIVFSSCRGHEFSYEDESIQNGYFTEYIISCMLDREADVNGDNMISIDEMRSYVPKAVSADTDGLQNPTVDRDNIYQDFGFSLMKRREP